MNIMAFTSEMSGDAINISRNLIQVKFRFPVESRAFRYVSQHRLIENELCVQYYTEATDSDRQSSHSFSSSGLSDSLSVGGSSPEGKIYLGQTKIFTDGDSTYTEFYVQFDLNAPLKNLDHLLLPRVKEWISKFCVEVLN
jgi:hypothetical protein